MILFKVTEKDGNYDYVDIEMLEYYLQNNDDPITVDIFYACELQKGEK